MVDPRRDVVVYLDLARHHGLRIVAVTEPHVDADFLSGTRELAAATGATAYVSGDGGGDWQYDFPAERLHDGDTIELGGVTVTARHTPGAPRSISRSSSPTPPSRRAPGISSAGTSSSRAIWRGRIRWTRRPV